MMTIQQLTRRLTDSAQMKTLREYEDFAEAFIDFSEQGLQARIVCQNEVNYQFFQYREECSYNISRPINSDLFCSLAKFRKQVPVFNKILKDIKKGHVPENKYRTIFNSIVYTLQQSIGVALDALPAGNANQAKKVNGDCFERLIRLLMQEVGIDCSTGVVHVPVKDDEGVVISDDMNYQHDLIGKKDGQIKFLGSVKTSSKDRLSKIFTDKILFNRLTNTDTPYIAVFLNDVQRAKSKNFGKQRINSTFLSGHFKAYTLKLTPLDGVFYCDLRPNMKTDPFLSRYIHGIDKLYFDELPTLCR